MADGGCASIERPAVFACLGAGELTAEMLWAGAAAAAAAAAASAAGTDPDADRGGAQQGAA